MKDTPQHKHLFNQLYLRQPFINYPHKSANSQ